jgi:glutamate/tyrosine decarboxylase-like PLP-dependent enzyme
MYTYELSPVASLIEQEILKKMCDKASFPEGSSGVLTTGGSNGNMLGLLCAR